MIVCPTCNKRMPTEKILGFHTKKAHSVVEPVNPEPTTNTPPVEALLEEDVPESLTLPITDTPENTSPPIPETPPYIPPPPQPEIVKLTFRRPVEIRINGIGYEGTTVEAPNMEVASEIVRIAREAYGSDILV